MYDNLTYLMGLSEDELLTRLVPANECHSSGAIIPRGKEIFDKCVKRSQESLLSFYKAHKGPILFTEDTVMALIPILSNSVPISTAVIVSILILKYGIPNV